MQQSSAIPPGVSPFMRAIITEYQRDAGIVGEEANIGATFAILCTTFYRREQRLHSAVINLSGAGKTTLVESVLKPFRAHRKEMIIDVVRFTGAALERFKDGMDGMILVLSQSVGNEPTSIRPLLSEGKLGLMVVEQPEGSKKHESVILQAEGMPVFITTSTDPNVDPELLRRVVQRTVDESTQQTQRVKKLQASKASTLRLPRLIEFRLVSEILRRLDDFRPHSTIDQVLVPFAEAISDSLPDDLEIRSKLPQFLKLIQSIALLKAITYRGLFEVEITKPVKAKLRIALAYAEDLTDALFIAGSSFFHLIPATAQAILDFLSTQIDNNVAQQVEGYKACTVREIQSKLKLPNSTIHKYAEFLADKGLILKEQKANDRNVEVNLYTYTPLAIERDTFDLSKFSFISWYKKEFTEKGFNIRYSKLENPLEIALLSSVEDTFYACVEKVKNPSPRTSGDTFYATEKDTVTELPKEKVAYCPQCDTAYGAPDAKISREHTSLTGHVLEVREA